MKKTNLKKLLSLLLAISMLLCTLCACSSSDTTSSTTSTSADDEEASDDTAEETTGIITNSDLEVTTAETESDDAVLNVVLYDEPAHTNPLYGNAGDVTDYVLWCLFDTLFELDTETNEITCRVAESSEWIDDTHLQITLRDDVIMYDGSNYTASDVLWTIEVGQSYNNVTNYSMYDLSECSVVDDYTVIIGYTSTYSYAYDKLVSPIQFPVVSQSSCEALGGIEECLKMCNIGGGKYYVSEWVEGQSLTLERNEDYWDTDNVCYYKYITFTFVSDAASRAMAVQSGQADVAVELTTAQYESLADDENVVVYIPSTGSTRAFYFNVQQEPFDDIRVRQAVSYLIDIDTVASVASDGLAEGIDSIVPESYTYYDASIETDWEGSVEDAVALLAEAGYDSDNPLTFTCVGQESDSTVLEVIQSMLLQGGVEMKIEILESGTLMSTLCSGDYQCNLATGAFVPSMIYLTTQQYDSRIDVSTKYGGPQVDDDELNSYLDVIYNSVDETELQEAWSYFQRYTIENYVGVPLYSGFYIDVVSSNLKGVQFTSSAAIDLTALYE
ncbi:MAG: ABC transporter substrate-binding protein [Oscillospiraceae bacterium]|nr:ABC transporter substrate-binding protein [Oscillospiraceae bacterium]